MANNRNTVCSTACVYLTSKELNKTSFITEYLRAMTSSVTACEKYWSAYDLSLEI